MKYISCENYSTAFIKYDIKMHLKLCLNLIRNKNYKNVKHLHALCIVLRSTSFPFSLFENSKKKIIYLGLKEKKIIVQISIIII